VIEMLNGSSLIGNRVKITSGHLGNGWVDLPLTGLIDGTTYSLTARIIDRAGNEGDATATAFAVTIDTTRPVVSSFSTSSVNGTYKVGDVIDITATLSETVQEGAKLDLTLNKGSAGAITLTRDATDATLLKGSYRVTEGDLSSDLTVASYAFVLGAVPTDAAGNAMTSTTLPTGTNNLGGARNLVVDGVSPTITRFTSTKSDGAYKAGEAIVIQAKASENLQADATITVTLNSGGTAVLTRLIGSADVLEGTYTVLAGENADDLTVVSYALGTAVLVITLPASSLGATDAVPSA